ncbi:uncharacterized protein MONOS_10001 [Monocercomonoides exilis]|uniref:uncharacterized protein n=1 Tax=Monocercomonoides exilis TaxID=2049356 RepID=UPI0035598C7D|nr:hypothetical protein MONOS_10001 [Monocercomonoides exilis]|eukprot:MONOS_10001.1-p1 / transcript=MONOS_10001.1 / gene=MONOS_10001 / organism=Monocercomonoides_exilis_PA203 / gene_product=unspecified product / transcript_product=unspecified product / location=Mono_scaffold00436:5665-7630(-) / protein_length=566 / sequence_SO=supercontig / SO=protein_coding / is_pseudo=false
MIYGIRLFQIFLKFKISDDFRIRIRILLILIFCMFGIFCIRFCWTLTTLTNCNVFAPLINQLVDSVKEGQQRWAYYYTYYCLFFCVFEIVPSLLLLSVFFVLSLHSPKSKSDSRAASKVYYISKAKHGADIDGIAVLPVLPTEAVFQKQKGTRMGGSDRGKTRDREREKERERSGKRRSRDSRTRTYEGDMKDGTQVIITSNEEGGVRSQSRRYKQGSAKSGHKRREESESERGREDRRREREKSGAGQQAERGIHHSKNDMRSGERRAVHSPSPVSNQSSKAREAFGASYGKHHVHVHTHGHRHKGRKERGEWEKRERERERERERQRVEGSENEETVAMLRHEEQQQQQQQQQNIGASGVGVFGEGADGTGGGGGGGGGGNEDITLPSSLASSVGVLKEQGYMPISGAFFAAGNVLKEKEKERDKEREKEKEKEISEEDNYSINADGFGGYPYASSASPSCASPSRSSSSHPIPFSAFPFTSNAAISASSAANATAINSSSSFSSSSSSSSSTAAASLLASSFLSTSSSSSSSSSSVQLPPYSLHPNDDPTFILSEIQSFAPS